ncbi:calcium/sodium antiporter [Salisaeta longa]|uniref:calcium/sodium antiporter n=1 Tax=Salisaeta longa TaxID=503170 RepID=UPI00040C9F65
MAGLALLTIGAEGLVRGASSLARRLGMSALLVGLTVVAFGTSAPELVVSLGAALRGSSAVALGNVVGSNIANIGLILGTAALIQALNVNAQVIRVEVPLLVLVSAGLLALLYDGTVSRLEGGLLVAALVAYLVFSIRAARREQHPAVAAEYEEGVPPQRAWGLDALYVAGGLGLLVGGANLLVGGAITIAGALGVSEAVIGLTVVAVGTSLPELATSVVAAWRGEGDIAIGNAVGSCLFNILCILGITALVQPLSTADLQWADGAMLVGLPVLLLPLMRTEGQLRRWEGGPLLVIYAAYVAYLVT